MISLNTPCRNCTERTLGCHDACEKYKEFKEKLEHDKLLKKEYEEKHGEVYYKYKKSRKREK